MAITDLYGKILSYSSMAIRKQTALPALVNHMTLGDPSEAQPRGGTVNLVVPPEFVTRDVVPGSTPPASPADPSPPTVAVPLNHWKEVPIPLTDKHLWQIDNSGSAIPMFLQNAVGPIVEDITSLGAAKYKGLYGYVGTAGTTPFATSPIDAQNAKKVLTRQKAPKFMRQMLLNTDAYSNASGLSAFQAALNYGSSEVVRTGEIREAIGFSWHEDVVLDDIIHETGGGASWLVNQADHAIADTTIIIDTGSGAPVVGDIFTVAGDTQTYVVSSYGSNTITYAPAAKVAWANNAAITFKADHAINLAFNPYCFGFVSAPTKEPNIEGLPADSSMTWVDDMTGVALRLMAKREHYQTSLYLSCLWGFELVNPRLGVRIAG